MVERHTLTTEAANAIMHRQEGTNTILTNSIQNIEPRQRDHCDTVKRIATHTKLEQKPDTGNALPPAGAACRRRWEIAVGLPLSATSLRIQYRKVTGRNCEVTLNEGVREHKVNPEFSSPNWTGDCCKTPVLLRQRLKSMKLVVIER